MNSWVWVNTADPQTSFVFVSETIDCNCLRISARREQYPPSSRFEELHARGEAKRKYNVCTTGQKRPIWSVQQYKEQWIKLYKF